MALLAQFRALGPWRIGPDSGARRNSACVFPSDSLYSALTHAMREFGWLEEWVEATAANPAGSAVRLTSGFPYQRDLLYLRPPLTWWPPPESLRTPWAAAELIPARLVLDLFHGKPPVDDHWRVDGASRCLVPVERNQPWPGPLRPTRRWAAAVDRFTGTAAAYDTGCVEFHPTAGWWCACDFAGPADRERWTPRLQGAWRLLADTGLGGERSRGWGRFTQPEFREGELTELLFGKTFEATSSSHWLLSLFRPAEQDQVEWQRGAYQLVSRSGRVESPAAWSGWVEWGVEKASSALVSEGSVLVSRAPLTGSALDVAPAGFPHPVFRAGFALAVPIPEPAQS